MSRTRLSVSMLVIVGGMLVLILMPMRYRKRPIRAVRRRIYKFVRLMRKHVMIRHLKEVV